MRRLYQYLFAPCRTIEPLLWDHARGLLESEQVPSVERHLTDCPHCRREAMQYAQTVAVTQAARQVELPASQTDWHMLAQQLAPVQMRPTRRLLSPAWGVAMAAGICVLVALGTYNYRPHGTQPTSPNPTTPVMTAHGTGTSRANRLPKDHPAVNGPGEQVVRHIEQKRPVDKKQGIRVVRLMHPERAHNNRPRQIVSVPKASTPTAHPDSQPNRWVLQPALLDAAPGRSAPGTTEYVLGDTLPADERHGERTYVLGDTLSDDHPASDTVVEATGW